MMACSSTGSSVPWTWLTAILLCFGLLVGCSTSDRIPIEDVEIVCVSGGATGMDVFFQVPEGVQCEGIQIETLGNESTIAFLDAKAGAPVDSKAVVATEGAFAGNLLVKVPNPGGGNGTRTEYVLRVEGDPSSFYTWKSTEADDG